MVRQFNSKQLRHVTDSLRRDEKVKVLKSLRPLQDAEEVTKRVVREGQGEGLTPTMLPSQDVLDDRLGDLIFRGAIKTHR